MSEHAALTDDVREYINFIDQGVDYRIKQIIALVRADERKRIVEGLPDALHNRGITTGHISAEAAQEVVRNATTGLGENV